MKYTRVPIIRSIKEKTTETTTCLGILYFFFSLFEITSTKEAITIAVKTTSRTFFSKKAAAKRPKIRMVFTTVPVVIDIFIGRSVIISIIALYLLNKKLPFEEFFV